MGFKGTTRSWSESNNYGTIFKWKGEIEWKGLSDRKKNMQKTWADITQGIKSGADPGKDGRSTFHSFPL